MHFVEISTKEKIIEVGKLEFFEKGYEKASLRNICCKAKVTTGALYFSFKSKADLFDSIVSRTVIELNMLIEDMIQRELMYENTGEENEQELMKFLWKNRYEVLILLDKSTGTKYQGFKENFIQKIENAFILFFQKLKSPIDIDLIHILVSMKIQGYIEILLGGYTMKKSIQLAALIGCYSEGGFQKIIKKSEKCEA